MSADSKPTAEQYARYQVPFPAELTAAIVQSFRLDGSGTVLDLGCGPGALSIPLAAYAHNVIGMDEDGAMIEQARIAAARMGVRNIEWRVGPVETLLPQVVGARVAVVGRAFERMNRELILHQLDRCIEPGGGVAIAAGGGLARVENSLPGAEAWEHAVREVLDLHLGADWLEDRSFHTESGHIDVLRTSAFNVLEEATFPYVRQWCADDIIGYLYATSWLQTSLWKDREVFEHDLRSALQAYEHDHLVIHSGMFQLIVARRPA